MFDRSRIADDFSVAADHYGKRAKLQARIGDALIAKALPHIARNGLLVDVGAGSGELSKRWPVGPVVAIDLAVGMCEEARKKELLAINASALQLPLRDACADVVASNLMLQWIPEAEQFLSESFRLLKAGGILAITHFAEGTLAELERAFSDAGHAARVSEFHAPSAMMQQVRHAGFEVVSEGCEVIGERYYGVMDLCGFLRDIGASNKRMDRPRGLLTPRALRKVTAAYPRDGVHITASWVVQTIIARKAE